MAWLSCAKSDKRASALHNAIVRGVGRAKNEPESHRNEPLEGWFYHNAFMLEVDSFLFGPYASQSFSKTSD
jgi:hypothetical protein